MVPLREYRCGREGVADVFLLVGDGRGGADGFFDGVAIEAAVAPVQVAVESEITLGYLLYSIGAIKSKKCNTYLCLSFVRLGILIGHKLNQQEALEELLIPLQALQDVHHRLFILPLNVKFKYMLTV